MEGLLGVMGPPWRERVEEDKLWTKDKLLGNLTFRGKAEEEGNMKENILEDPETHITKGKAVANLPRW